MENVCVNVSYDAATPSSTPPISDRCQAIQASQLTDVTPAMQYYLKV
jgi:hypothetical protein